MKNHVTGKSVRLSHTRSGRGFAGAVAVQGAGAVFCALVSFALVVWLARVLGAERFGAYVALLNVVSLGLIVQEGGWPTAIYRDAARASQASATTASAGLALGHVVLATAALAMPALLLTSVAPAGLAVGDTLAAVLCMGVVAVMNLISARLRGAGRFAHEALWQSSARLVSALTIVLMLGALGAHGTIAHVFLAWGLGLLLVLAVAGRSWLERPRFAGLLGQGWRLWPFVLMSALSLWLLKGDLVILGWLDAERVAPAELSAYAAATRLSEAGVLLMAPLGNVLLRDFARLAISHEQGATERLVRLAGKVVLGIACAGGGAVLATDLLGDWLMPALFGHGYAAAGALLPWVVAVVPFAAINIVLAQLLTALHAERAFAFCMLLCGGALYLGIRSASARWGAIGAAQAAVFAHALLTVLAMTLSLLMLRRRTRTCMQNED